MNYDEILDDLSSTNNSIELDDTVIKYMSRISRLEDELNKAVFEKNRAELKLLQLTKISGEKSGLESEKLLNKIKIELEDLKISGSEYKRLQKLSNISFPDWVRMRAYDVYINQYQHTSTEPSDSLQKELFNLNNEKIKNGEIIDALTKKIADLENCLKSAEKISSRNDVKERFNEESDDLNQYKEKMKKLSDQLIERNLLLEKANIQIDNLNRQVNILNTELISEKKKFGLIKNEYDELLETRKRVGGEGGGRGRGGGGVYSPSSFFPLLHSSPPSPPPPPPSSSSSSFPSSSSSSSFPSSSSSSSFYSPSGVFPSPFDYYDNNNNNNKEKEREKEEIEREKEEEKNKNKTLQKECENLKQEIQTMKEDNVGLRKEVEILRSSLLKESSPSKELVQALKEKDGKITTLHEREEELTKQISQLQLSLHQKEVDTNILESDLRTLLRRRESVSSTDNVLKAMFDELRECYTLIQRGVDPQSVEGRGGRGGGGGGMGKVEGGGGEGGGQDLKLQNVPVVGSFASHISSLPPPPPSFPPISPFFPPPSLYPLLPYPNPPSLPLTLDILRPFGQGTVGKVNEKKKKKKKKLVKIKKNHVQTLENQDISESSSTSETD